MKGTLLCLKLHFIHQVMHYFVSFTILLSSPKALCLNYVHSALE